MAATYDVTAGLQSLTGDGGTPSASLNITPSLAASAVFLVIAWELSGGEAMSATPTCAGTNMVEVGTALSTPGPSSTQRVFRLENQPASARTVAWAMAGPGAAGNTPWIAFVFAVNGTDTSNCIGSTATNSAAGANSLAQNGASGDLLIAVMTQEDTGFDPTGGTASPGTKRGDLYKVATPGTDSQWCAFQTVAGTGSSQTLSFSPTGGTGGAAIRTIDVLAAAAGSPPPPSDLMHQRGWMPLLMQ